MPEMLFAVRWPDGDETVCYSPSLVIEDHLAEGESYPVREFERRSSAALAIASDRVRAKFGVPCGRAEAQAAEIVSRASGHRDPEARVTVLSFRRL